MFKKVLIANRGVIACRIIRTLDAMGIDSVAVYSEADRHSLHVLRATQAVPIGPAPAAQSYLKVESILEAAHQTGAQAIHPGYGFLSENADFAQACADAGIVFIGPRPKHLRVFGLKHESRALAEQAGLPLAAGSGLLSGLAHAQREAERIGYPVMLKSTAGGGGIGLQLVNAPSDLPALYDRVVNLAGKNFKEAGVFLEKYIARGRHIEVQIFGDGKGKVIALGERDCSAQRRNQKVIEETPAPNISDKTRKSLWDTAVALGQSVSYESAGTVEFLYDADTQAVSFLEVNTRLQVEHGVTEEVTGIDLVAWMIQQAAGELALPDQSAITPQGVAVQARMYAEDPGREFRPCSGLLTHVAWPAGGPNPARVETWVESGTEISPFYDPMLAKIIVKAATRAAALQSLAAALATTEIGGIETNLDYLRQLASSDLLTSGTMLTRSLQDFAYRADTIEVLSPGTQTTIQDWPGRLGYWAVGVPPSGPMDTLSFRLANRLIGNAQGTPALEITLTGPTLRFDTPRTVCLAGARLEATLDGEAMPLWTPVRVHAGQVLAIGAIESVGMRAYLAIGGGLACFPYLGSVATFTLGKFGGHSGKALAIGDILHLGKESENAPTAPTASPLVRELQSPLTNAWTIGVMDGPHGAPDFFTPEDITAFFAAAWEVHYNSSRTGVRLIGPKPNWARADGGEAGLHPSNIHDNAYAIGAVDFTGDMPVILGPDGPSLGGFVCPVTIVQSELWKIGQLRPADTIRFERLSPEQAMAGRDQQDRQIATLQLAAVPKAAPVAGRDRCILASRAGSGDRPAVVYRQSGDANLLVEYGPIVLDLELRFRIHALMTKLEALAVPGIIDLTPGIRSLQVHFDNRILPTAELLGILSGIESGLAGLDAMEVPSRIVRMPLSWNDPAVQKTIDKYTQSVRPDTPWCPSNIEFIRRINGLDSVDNVEKIVFSARYLVLGLGDVYLGAPVATPIDPSHRLVTTKYNPARTWTPDNVVGIGGAYMCVYGMEGPGGYQLFGRTAQVWNPFRVTTEFPAGSPWLLRFFDQIEFYRVSSDDLSAFRDGFLQGKVGLDIEPTTFRLADYRAYLAANARSIEHFKHRQQQAFEDERARWQAAGTEAISSDTGASLPAPDDALPAGHTALTAPIPGSIWRITVKAGQRIAAGDLLIILESMKMEMPVVAPVAGIVREIRCTEGHAVASGQILIVFEPLPQEATS